MGPEAGGRRLEDILSIRCDIEEELEVLSSSEVITIDEDLCRKDHWGNRWAERTQSNLHVS